MIKSLAIENFQSHSETFIELDKGLNVFTGLGTAGKTPIVRALITLFFNRPLGMKYLSRWCYKTDKIYIAVTLDDDTSVSITKSKSGSVYTLTDSEGNEEEFTGFGAGVPDKIREVLNISDINIQTQSDPPFLIRSSPGEFSKTINKITNLADSDEWIKIITKDINSNNSILKVLKGDIREINEKLKNFKDFDKTTIAIDQLKRLDAQTIEQKEHTQFLIGIENDLLENKSQLDKLNKLKDIHPIIDKIELLYNAIATSRADIIYLNDLIEIKNKIKNLKELKDVYHWINRIEILSVAITTSKIIITHLEDLMVNKKRIKKLKEYSKLTLLLDRIEELHNSINTNNVKPLEDLFQSIDDKQYLLTINNKLSKTISEIEQIETNKEEINNTLYLAHDLIYKHETKNKLLKERTALIPKYIDKLKQEGKCPLCFGETDKEMEDRVIRSMV